MVFPFRDLKDFNIQLTDEHELFRKAVRQFVERELEPRVAEIERSKEIPEDLIKKGIEMGFTGVVIPEEYGGQGGGTLMTVILMEELSRVCPAYGTCMLVSGLFTYPVLKYGTEEQKRKYIPPIARGEAFAAHANTEPGAGSDVAGIQTTAVKKGDKYILNGRKIFITGADRAKYFVVSASPSQL
jgi:alkylation response protein AidB-like acyl-CoA dehydrogenase